MSSEFALNPSLDRVKESMLIDFHYPVSYLGQNLPEEQLFFFHKLVDMMNLHVYIGGVETVDEEEDLTAEFDQIMPEPVPTSLMDDVFQYLRIQLLSTNSIQVERATILISHIFMNYNDNLVNRYINHNRRFMKTLGIVARRQIRMNTYSSLSAANRILLMIRLWAETYKLLKKPNSYIWDTYSKLQKKHGIYFLEEPDPALLKKTCLKVGRKTNMDSSSEIMKELEAEAASDFENYKVFHWEATKSGASPLSPITDDDTVCSEHRDGQHEHAAVGDDIMNESGDSDMMGDQEKPTRSIMVMLGLSSPEATSPRGARPLSVSGSNKHKPSLGEQVNSELYRRPSVKASESESPAVKNSMFSFGLSPFTSPLEKPTTVKNGQRLSQRSGKTLDVDFSNVSKVRAKWQQEANKSFTTNPDTPGAVKRSNSIVRAE